MKKQGEPDCEGLFEAKGIQLSEKSIVEGLMDIAFAESAGTSEDRREAPKVSERMKALQILGEYIGIFEKSGAGKEPDAPKLTVIYDYRGVSEEL